MFSSMPELSHSIRFLLFEANPIILHRKCFCRLDQFIIAKKLYYVRTGVHCMVAQVEASRTRLFCRFTRIHYAQGIRECTANRKSRAVFVFFLFPKKSAKEWKSETSAIQMNSVSGLVLQRIFLKFPGHCDRATILYDPLDPL